MNLADVITNRRKRISIISGAETYRQAGSFNSRACYLEKLLLLSMMSYGVEYPFHQFGPALLATCPPRLLLTQSLLAFVEECASTAQKWPKHCLLVIYQKKLFPQGKKSDVPELAGAENCLKLCQFQL
ncbi:uncharacterized protein VK521_000615 [Ammospiza maritima maritima]